MEARQGNAPKLSQLTQATGKIAAIPRSFIHDEEIIDLAEWRLREFDIDMPATDLTPYERKAMAVNLNRAVRQFYEMHYQIVLLEWEPPSAVRDSMIDVRKHRIRQLEGLIRRKFSKRGQEALVQARPAFEERLKLAEAAKTAARLAGDIPAISTVNVYLNTKLDGVLIRAQEKVADKHREQGQRRMWKGRKSADPTWLKQQGFEQVIINTHRRKK